MILDLPSWAQSITSAQPRHADRLAEKVGAAEYRHDERYVGDIAANGDTDEAFNRSEAARVD